MREKKEEETYRQFESDWQKSQTSTMIEWEIIALPPKKKKKNEQTDE